MPHTLSHKIKPSTCDNSVFGPGTKWELVVLKVEAATSLCVNTQKIMQLKIAIETLANLANPS